MTPQRVKLGMALDQLGDYSGANPSSEAVRLSPGESQGYYFLAVALFSQAEGLSPAGGSQAMRLYQEAADCPQGDQT